MDQGDVRHAGHLPAERAIDVHLPRRIGQVIVAPDDLRHAHVVVVDHHGQHVGGRPVGAQQHEVVEVAVRPGDGALHGIVQRRLTVLRGLEADYGLDAGGGLGRVAVTPASVVARRPAFFPGEVAHLLELGRRGIAMIGPALGQQACGRFAMTLHPLGLIDHVTVPIEPEPRQSVDDGVDGRCRGALAVRVLDPQQHLAAAPPRIEPVEQRRPGAADMQKPRRRRRKARHNLI